jgi:hypothetical protein
MQTYNTGSSQRTSIREPLDGTQIYKNMTMRSCISQGKPTLLLMLSLDPQGPIEEKQTTRLS